VSGAEVAGAYFLDSSALVKRYVQETGTAWIRGLTRRNPSTVIYIARITAVEVTCAVARRRKGRTITPRRASSILYRFRQHLAGRYTVAEVTRPLLEDAMRLGNSYALRAYDTVRLAVALEVNRSHQTGGSGPITLISADQALNDAATAEGLAVDDPRSHPSPLMIWKTDGGTGHDPSRRRSGEHPAEVGPARRIRPPGRDDRAAAG
jgi:predicted nucleic acid-binding protein